MDRKLYCIKVVDEDRYDPAYGVEPMDCTESPEGPPRRRELKKGDYQLITLFKADDPSYDHDTMGLDDGDTLSSTSSEYFTCEEDLTSNKSSPGSEISDSELDVVESELNNIFMDIQRLSRRLQQANNQNHTLQSNVGRFQRNILKADNKIKKLFY
ncbi:uncharacterized protein LOC129987473 [Argiope bruennichi]|uniref:uncharacterized protein LOC129987473 n=1 Tax=Argiope bruennichi TaxID=94029 RepID=UPI002494EA53|nr:uncharacterized protein LOC129987473 [Argiope bruennichi]